MILNETANEKPPYEARAALADKDFVSVNAVPVAHAECSPQATGNYIYLYLVVLVFSC